MRVPLQPPGFAMTTLELRQSARQELSAVTARLVLEMAGRLPAQTVIRCVEHAREQLLGSGVRAGLAPATESMARLMLHARLPAHGSGH